MNRHRVAGTRSARRYKGDTDEHYWPSIVDIMASTALILFFVMAMIATLSYYRSLTYARIADENRQLISEIEIILQQKSELVEQQQKLMIEQKHLLQDIEAIIAKREAVYDNVLSQLNARLGEGTVKRNETRLYVDAEILFEYDKWVLKEDGEQLAYAMGEVFLQIIKQQKPQQNQENVTILSIEVIGHTDNRGADAYNRQLSTQRAAVFVDHMMSTMSSVDHLNYGSYFKAAGMSKYSPVAGTVMNQTDPQRDKNRRIELMINFSDDDFAYLLEKYAGITSVQD